MTQITVLKCPNCGALFSRNELKCKYCGAEVVLSPDSSSLTLRNQSACPKCGAANEKSSWFCLNCGTILTKDTEMLKRLQRKLRFIEEEMKKEFVNKVHPKIDLEPEELFYSTLSREQGENFYGVTNKRIMQYINNEYSEILISDIVAVYPPKVKSSSSSSILRVFVPIPQKFEMRFEIDVMTYHGLKKLEEIKGNPNYCGLFYGCVLRTVDEYEKGKKNVMNFILRLPLSE